MPARIITPAPPPAEILIGVQLQDRQTLTPGWRPKGTRDWLLILTVAGTGSVRIEGRERQLRTGDAVLFAPATPHDYGVLEGAAGWTNVWAHFRPPLHWLGWLKWPVFAGGVSVLPLPAHVAAAAEAELRRALELSTAPLRLRTAAAMNALERALLGADAVNPLYANHSLDPRIAEAMRTIGEQLVRPLRIADLADASGLSRSRFSVLFTEQVKMSAQAYLEQARLGRAAQLLQATAWPIADIAEDVGYPNPFYFSTRFRHQFGTSPTAFRRRYGDSFEERGE